MAELVWWFGGVCAVALAACGYSKLPELGTGGACGDTFADPVNCGACGHRCPDLPGIDGDRVTCSGGTCQVAAACRPGLADCDDNESTGCESDLRDPATCGSCEVTCSGAQPLCSAAGNSWACRATCSGPEMQCSGTCADIAMDRAHCGRCDHSCGGGDCVAGECQPVAVATGRTGPVELAVTADAVFWSEAGSSLMDGKIATCRLPRCSLAPHLIVEGRGRVGPLAVVTGTIYFVGCSGDSCDDFHRLYQCPVAGCPALPPITTSNATAWLALAVGPTHAYVLAPGAVGGCFLTDCAGTDQMWRNTVFGGSLLVGFALDGDSLYVDGEAEIRTCPEAEGCAAPAVVATSSAVASPFRAHAGRLYWFAASAPGIVRLYSCNAASCTSTVFASDADGVSELEVDDTGVYWMNASQGSIRHCPLTGCVGAPAHLGTGLATPKALTLGTGFVYWIEGSDIKRVAKP